MIFVETPQGQQCHLEEHERRALCSENVMRCLAYRENPPPAPVQMDYVAKPLVTPLPVRRDANHATERGRRRAAEHQKKFEPIRLTAIAPPPPPSLLDSALI